jgi:hypothetical protein
VVFMMRSISLVAPPGWAVLTGMKKLPVTLRTQASNGRASQDG